MSPKESHVMLLYYFNNLISKFHWDDLGMLENLKLSLCSRNLLPLVWAGCMISFTKKKLETLLRFNFEIPNFNFN